MKTTEPKKKFSKPIPLSEAAWTFSPAKLRKSHREALAKERPKFEKPDSAKLVDRMALFSKAAELTGLLFHDHFERQKPWLAMESYVSSLIVNERLVASGFQTKPSVGAKREIIPPVMFNNAEAINWDANSVEHAGYKYEVIVVELPAINSGVPQLAPYRDINAPKRRPGRISKSDIINQIIDELIATGVNLNSYPRDIAMQKIITRAKEKEINTANGFSKPVSQRSLALKLGPR